MEAYTLVTEYAGEFYPSTSGYDDGDDHNGDKGSYMLPPPTMTTTGLRRVMGTAWTRSALHGSVRQGCRGKVGDGGEEEREVST